MNAKLFILLILIASVFFVVKRQNVSPQSSLENAKLSVQDTTFVATNTYNSSKKFSLNYPSKSCHIEKVDPPYNRPAITVIKPQPKENLTPVPASEERINKRQQPERLSASPSQSPVVSEDESDDQPGSGITKIGKRPTEKETQEMNAQGIVMY